MGWWAGLRLRLRARSESCRRTSRGHSEPMPGRAPAFHACFTRHSFLHIPPLIHPQSLVSIGTISLHTRCVCCFWLRSSRHEQPCQGLSKSFSHLLDLTSSHHPPPIIPPPLRTLKPHSFPSLSSFPARTGSLCIRPHHLGVEFPWITAWGMCSHPIGDALLLIRSGVACCLPWDCGRGTRASSCVARLPYHDLRSGMVGLI